MIGEGNRVQEQEETKNKRTTLEEDVGKTMGNMWGQEKLPVEKVKSE